ncbi:MAG TPA: hypothetical protein VG652_09960 [Gaiellaceae bacterium]|nr:hypothetical protein [Gaiellaceae bacterium]
MSTPRPVPHSWVPAIGGTAAVVVALPIFAIAGWPLEAWAIAAALWAVNQGIGLLLQRLPLGMGNLASAGVVAFGRLFRAAGLVTVLIIIAVSNSSLGLPAAVLYGIAFTVEFGLSLLTFFAGEAGS